MKEIVSVQVGQCGNQIGTKFWQTIAKQHAIDLCGYYDGDSDVQLEKISTYFSESETDRFMPRTILVDLDPTTLSSIRNGPNGNFFRPEDYVQGQYGAGNNWAKGHYTEGAELIDYTLDTIRKEFQRCDSPQGFEVTHGLGGGTGSGMGTLIVTKLKEEYPNKWLESFPIFTVNKSDGIVEPYTNTLSIPYLVENADNCLVFDNEALYDICFRTLRLATPTLADLNHLVFPAMSAITSSYRFPTESDETMRQLAYEIVPFPKLHFLIVGFSPLTSRRTMIHRNMRVNDLSNQVFDHRNMLCDADPSNGRYFAASAIFRGKISTLEVEKSFANRQILKPLSFVEWMPSRIKSSVFDIPIAGFEKSATSIGNSSSIDNMFRRFSEQFTAMFRRKAFLHWYIGEGMDESEFIESKQALQDLREEYQKYERSK